MVRVIRKYKNRKYYDTEESRYVNLAEIFDLVKEGSRVRVFNDVNQDITVDALLGAILERGKESTAPQFTTEMLTSVINTGDGTLAGFFNATFNKGV